MFERSWEIFHKKKMNINTIKCIFYGPILYFKSQQVSTPGCSAVDICGSNGDYSGKQIRIINL